MTRRTERIADERAEELLQRANVVGTAGGDHRVLVLVTRKVPLSALGTDDVVPNIVDGVRTDVVEVGDVQALLDPGTSIGLAGSGTGTLGAVVRDSHRTYGLTNCHVAADTNLAEMLSEIHSPGAADGLGPVIGRLGRYEPVRFDGPNWIDAALVELPRSTPRTHPRRTLTPRNGWKLKGRGRTSGPMAGKVIGRNAAIQVGFGAQGVALFRGQTLTTTMLQPGDSGTVIETVGGFACLLGFAGSDQLSVATPIDRVLDTLGVHT